MMTAHGRIAGRPKFSAYQYQPEWLLYDSRWWHMCQDEVCGRIAAAIAADPKAKDAAARGWQAICSDAKPHSVAEPEMDEAVAWLTEHQAEVG
eukprot:4878208-Alexandrium_andersonii.AAC.1